MKKIKVIIGAVLRVLGVLAPGVAFGWWAWGLVPELFAILAAVGLEALWVFLIAFMTMLVQAVKDIRKKKAPAA